MYDKFRVLRIKKPVVYGQGRAHMSTRTVRLDDEAEAALEQIRRATGLSISGVLKQGLLTLRDDMVRKASCKPYDIYKTLDLGPGGDAIASSTDTRRGVREAIRRKLGR